MAHTRTNTHRRARANARARQTTQQPNPPTIKPTPKPALPDQAYDRVPRAQLTFTDETCWLTRFNPDGAPTTTYPVALHGVARAFRSLPTYTGILAPDTLCISYVENTIRLAIWLPPRVYALNFALKQNELLNVPLPGFVFIGQGTQYKIFAATQRPRSAKNKLYKAPLPNVHADGEICVGNVQFPKCSANTIHRAAQLFFESYFNFDLADDKIRERAVSRKKLFADDYPFNLDDDQDEWDDDEIAADDPLLMVADPEDLGVQVRERVESNENDLIPFLRSLHNARATEFPNKMLVPSPSSLRDDDEEMDDGGF